MFSLKPDYDKTRQRMEAFWELELMDRPMATFALYKPGEEQETLPPSNHATPAERWMDAQYLAEFTLTDLNNQEYVGDTLPMIFPNLGPEVLAAMYGCPIHFGDYGTSWTDPILEDWADVDKIQLDWDSFYLKKLVEMTDVLLEVGKNTFIVGLTDFHPGGDLLAAFRDPANLAVDMITHRPEIEQMLKRVQDEYYQVYDLFYHKLRAAGQPITSWLPLFCDGRYYIPSNDFSIMISKKMYDEVFLPGIVEECRFLDHSIYHLDGPGALRHLDSILAIPDLDALQWVPGAGNEGFARWIDVYKRAQAAKKGIYVSCDFNELELIMQTLDPHGVFLGVGNTPDRESAEAMIKRLEKWALGK